jgi:RimJ/RimL family protein N-acetyltransferase
MKSFSFTVEHYTLRTLLHDENFENYYSWIRECLGSNKVILGVNRSNQQAIKACKKFGFLETDNSDEKSIKIEYLIGPTIGPTK